MAWLLHPDDFANLKELLPASAILPPIGSVKIARSRFVERGHIADSEHPELGTPIFTEFGERYEKVLEERRKRFDEVAATLAAVLPKLSGPIPQEDDRPVDSDELLTGLIDACSGRATPEANRAVASVIAQSSPPEPETKVNR